MNDNVPLTTQDMLARLEVRYAPPGWITIRECSDRTGFRNRSADLVALGIWPSRGLEIIGFEVKSFRGDWLKELKMPEKADAVAIHCDRWYVVVTDPDIIKPGELPANWGLIVPRGDVLRVVTEAAYEDKGSVKRTFFMSMIRRVVEGTVPKALFDAKVDAEIKGREENFKRDWEWRHSDNEKQLIELRTRVKEFEEASGIYIANSWDDGKAIGAAVKFVLAHSTDEHISRLKWLSKQLKDNAQDIDKDIDEFTNAHSMMEAKNEK